MNRLAQRLIQHAARCGPPSLAERLEEEWLADLAEQRGQLARVRFAVGCCWATRIIAHEHCVSEVAAAGSATGSKVMTAYVQHDYAFFSRRTTAFVLIVGLHGLLVYVLANGLARGIIPGPPPTLLSNMIDPAPQTHDPPPLPQPKFTDAPVDVPVVSEVPFDPPPSTDGITQRVLPPDVPSTPASPTAPKIVNRLQGGPGKGFPNSDDYYPPVSIRMGESGTAAIQVCVDTRGRLTASPTLIQSSGSARLDEGALKLAQAGSGRYRPTTEDGQPVDSCYQFRVRFQYKN